MPVERFFDRTLGLNYICPKDPFVPDDLFKRALQALSDNEPPKLLSAPMILDFRNIDLLQFDAQDFRRLVRQRLTLSDAMPGGPCDLPE